MRTKPPVDQLVDETQVPWSQRLYGHTFCATQLKRLKTYSPTVNMVRLSFCEGLDGTPVRELVERVKLLLVNAPRDMSGHQTVLQNVFLAVAQAHVEQVAHGKPCVVGFLAGSNAYRKADGASLPGHRAVMGTLRALEHLGLVQLTISNVNGRVSYLTPTPAFFQQFPWEMELLWQYTGINRVRVMTKKVVDYEWVDGKLVTKVRPGTHYPAVTLPAQALRDLSRVSKQLAGINHHAGLYDYWLCGQDDVWFKLGQDAAVYQIVFNDSSTRRGGRNFNQLQNQPQRDHRTPTERLEDKAHPERHQRCKPVRQTLHIARRPVDGRSGTAARQTVELDFSNQHFMMAYHVLGQALDGDGYLIALAAWKLPDHYTPEQQLEIKRTLLKVICLALFNCGDADKPDANNRKSANMTAMVQYQSTFLPMYPDCPLPSTTTMRRNKKGVLKPSVQFTFGPSDIVQAIIDKHPLVADLMFRGHGKFFQYLDGCIARQVVCRFNLSGKPIVCIHDSFMVWPEDADFLRQCMVEEYVRVLSQQPDWPLYQGQLPVIKVSKPRPRNLPPQPAAMHADGQVDTGTARLDGSDRVATTGAPEIHAADDSAGAPPSLCVQPAAVAVSEPASPPARSWLPLGSSSVRLRESGTRHHWAVTPAGHAGRHATVHLGPSSSPGKSKRSPGSMT